MQWADLVGRTGPILGFVICITVIAELADAAGVFRVVAWSTARLARGSVIALWLLVVAVATLCSAVLSLDTTAVLITPVVIVLARELGLHLGLFVYTAVWLANTTSLILPVSNLTNLLAVSWLSGRNAGAAAAPGYARLMWLPAVVALVMTVGWLAVLFRRSLTGRYRLPHRPTTSDRWLFWIAAVVCAGLGPAFALGANVVVTAAAGALALVIGFWARRPELVTWRLLPWRLILGVAALFVLAQFARTAGLDRLLSGVAGSGESGLALLQLSGVSAVGANLVNNLPAYLALEPLAGSPVRMAALLLGTNAGSLILPWGSLATLLWAARCRSGGIRINWWRFGRRSLVLSGSILLGGVGAVALMHGHQV